MDIDVVIIGVNAQATLGACIQSVLASGHTGGSVRVFYVDGGSTDTSLEVARAFPGVRTIALNAVHPTPGMGRNAGWRAGDAPLVQFLDADTILAPGWLETAPALAAGKDVGAVFGRRDEASPGSSLYNRIAQIEWNPPAPENTVSDQASFGGDVMVRRAALEASGGYDEELVAGEDPDLGVRLTKAGWRLVFANRPMTVHDLAMTRLSQYLRRAHRTGYGFAAVAARHGGFWAREVARILVRGGLAPLAVLAGGISVLLHPAWATLSAAGLALILHPRLRRTRALARTLNLDAPTARLYAWHCSLAVVPQFIGAGRYFLGRLTNRPLRNRPARLATRAATRTPILLLGLSLTLGAPLSGCNGIRPSQTPEAARPALEIRAPKPEAGHATAQAIREMSQALPRDYLLGPGDVVRLDVWNRPEVSDADLRVAPDGTLNLQRIGPVQVAGKSLACVTAEIVRKLSCYYITPEVRLAVTEYRNNKAYVLGRVANPGVVEFTGRGTLLEALSLAGGLPVSNSDVELTRCALIRGRHRILWIDLGELLHGGKTALNAPLANDDVLYIPSGSEALAYVMGEVRNPGVVRMGARPLTLLDALMQAGGPTQDADLDSAYLIRFGQDRSVHRLDLEQMLEQASMTAHVRLADRDVLYLAPDGVARFNYHLRRIMPTLQILDLGTSVLEGFGVMPEVRQGVWGQEGFVDD